MKRRDDTTERLIPKRRPRRRKAAGAWQRYEEVKGKLGSDLTPKQYEQECREIARKMGI